MKHIILFFAAVIGISLFFNSCSKEYSYESPVPPGNAVFSFKDSLGNCLPNYVHGTFYNGVTPGGDTAYVEVHVHVDSVGNYKITTAGDLQNGFMFADSGFFGTTGDTLVKLRPVGTPVFPQATTFFIDTTLCNFTVNVNPLAWQFSTDNATYSGLIDSAFIYDTSGAKFLTLYGYTASGDSAFVTSMLLPTGEITPGNYSTKTSAILYFENLADTTDIYKADPGTTNVETTITITSYDSSSNIIEGTFSGQALDTSQNVVNIINGKFKAKVVF